MLSFRDKRINLFNLISYIVFFLFFFLLSLVIFFISFNVGNKGISIQLAGGGDDGTFYYNEVMRILSGDKSNLTSVYPLILSVFPKLFGVSDYMVVYYRLFNVLGVLLLLLISVKTAKYTISNEIGKQTNHLRLGVLFSCFYMFYISFVIVAVFSIYRDVWIYFFYILSTYCGLKLLRKFSFIYFFLLIISLASLYLFREYAAFSYVLAFIIFTINKSRFFAGNKFRTLILAVISLGLYFTFFLNYKVPILDMSLSDALNYRLYFIEKFTSGSQLGINLTEGTYLSFLKNYSLSFFYNLLSPLPWQIRNIQYLVIFLCESLPLILILIFLLKKKEMIKGNKELEFLIIHATTWMALISITNDNIGAGTRLRAITYILIVIVFFVVRFVEREKIARKD
ncbi:hypothetical protein [Priestia aryabhattai]|uniref:hypothetical protein n=1 Tax=Priestia aryabhattai TaxID=412384 RepID=UPI0008DE2DF5|nr:hypothetical protein [Priestia aryabhattai]OHY77570.1 hypothetical protein BCV52_23300 [Priestia aryabhattai]